MDFRVGTTPTLAAENFRPLWHTPFFIAPRVSVARSPTYLIEEGRIVGEYRLQRVGYAVDTGALIGNKAQIRLGYEQNNTEALLQIGNPMLPLRGGQEALVYLDVTVDTQNSPMVPTRGIFLRSRVARYLDTADLILADGTRTGEDDFTRAEIRASWFKRAGPGRLFR